MKTAVISNLYNNILEFKHRSRLEEQFTRYSERVNADFVNVTNVERTWMVDMLGKELVDPDAENDGKKYAQLGKLDILDHAFGLGYDWVAWIDADVIFHSYARNVFPGTLKKDTIYWLDKSMTLEAREKHGQGPAIFTQSLKKQYRKKYLKYGNMGLCVLHKSMWHKIKSGLRKYQSDPKSFFSPVEDMHKFQARIEQACLALLFCRLDIKVDSHPENPMGDGSMIHLIGKNLPLVSEFIGAPNNKRWWTSKVEIIDRLFDHCTKSPGNQSAPDLDELFDH